MTSQKTSVNPLSKDIQSERDHRSVALDEVGVCDLSFPLTISGAEQDPEAAQDVQASLELSVSLASDNRGIHMSRLLESVLDSGRRLSLAGLGPLIRELRERQGAERAYMKVSFGYFLDRTAPVTGKSAPQAYTVTYEASLEGDGQVQLQQEIGVPITTLCPCSKAISDYGAHNQRGLLSIRLFHDAVDGGSPLICLEDVVALAERSGSAPLYPVLKREDERFVTMQAFDHPRFVEDVARSAATLLRDAQGFDRFSLRITNFESIHDHNAFARVYPTAPKDV